MEHKIIFDSIDGHIYIKHCNSEGEAKTDLVTVMAGCQYDITEQFDKMAAYRETWKKNHNIKHSPDNNARDKIFRPCGCIVCGHNAIHECQLPVCEFVERKTSPVA